MHFWDREEGKKEVDEIRRVRKWRKKKGNVACMTLMDVMSPIKVESEIQSMKQAKGDYL